MKLYCFDRCEKLIHYDDLSVLTPDREVKKALKLSMSENEIFVFQLAVLSDGEDVIEKISSQGESEISCINTDCVDKWGNSYTQRVALKENEYQPLFFTVRVKKLGKRTEQNKITITSAAKSVTFELTLEINSAPVTNLGYDDLWRLSRIKWLNSTLYQDDSVVAPYVPPVISDGRLCVLGRELELTDCGLPSQIYSKFDEGINLNGEAQKQLFYKPAEFKIGDSLLNASKTQSNCFNNRIEILSSGENDDYSSRVSSVLRYDGVIEYSVKIKAKRDFVSDNCSLTFFVSNDCTSLMHGLGKRASRAKDFEFSWDNDKQQDCLFIGCVNCGMRVKFKAENYRRPLINIFYKNLPLVTPVETWDNNGKGRISLKVRQDCTRVSAYTGEKSFRAGEERNFLFEIHMTPLKPIDYKKAFSVRYLHNNKLKDEIKDIDEAYKNNLSHVIFHQGNILMPYINYPFYQVDRLRNAVKYAGKKNIGVKVYYTEREHSNHMAETFVYKALGDEIILRKRGVSHSWQKEKPQWLIDNFGEDIIPGWFVKYKHGKFKGLHDFSFIVRPDTRLDNYYVEGLNWLVENVGIKGIYIDDTSLDRTTLERAKKVLQKNNGLIDMHMWNHEEVRAGDVSCTNLYTEIMPFLDSIWLGEGFFYKKYSPEYLLAEVSGIPYGLTGQMLQDGGDLYCGMLYAMNNRYGWGHKNAVDLYRIWDDFGISYSKMLGYWHSENPVSTDNENVFCTVYLREKSALLCFYNFSKNREKFNIFTDTEKLGFIPRESKELKPGSSLKRSVNINKTLSLSGRKGIIICIRG